ncbi:TRAP transporter large permease subunit [Bradyrhizobium sp. LHD-71]|uniref:TRAP transporter large permease n=1 Tax=Bradyrhizobium sp. LHD-71 TaxID=3072141 RepID=UPI00280D61D8|nr:TRAP transporter large permease subunit [Bradyrhizobium sp. LHD-71]MDQ8730165.1 TRAP transporter large permease subunit [Bradyrhizobium sp. LHD-71]
MTAFLIVGLIFLLLALRQPLLVILLAIAAVVHLKWGQGRLDFIIEDMWVGLDKEVILSIPLFILCGNVMTRGSIAQRLIRILAAITKPLPGGLAVACILSCAVFAAISGSSIVTMLAIGSVMYPAMRQAGYDLKFTLGAIMSGGTLGIIIPPSIPMIIYALVTETSVTDLFAAGFGPGILITVVLSTYAVFVNRHIPTQRFNLAELWDAFKKGIWAALLPVILLGGIYSGYFTATEAAAVALCYAILVEVLIHRELKLSDFYGVVLETSKLGGSLFPVLAVALSLNIILTEHRAPQALVEFMQGYVTSPLTFMLLVNLLLLLVGCLMTTGEAILILAPLLAPVAGAYGYDKVLFGLIMILNLEIGYLTPPVGLNLIVAMSAFKQNFGLLCRAAIPFILLLLLCLVLVVWQPWIAMSFVKG